MEQSVPDTPTPSSASRRKTKTNASDGPFMPVPNISTAPPTPPETPKQGAVVVEEFGRESGVITDPSIQLQSSSSSASSSSTILPFASDLQQDFAKYCAANLLPPDGDTIAVHIIGAKVHDCVWKFISKEAGIHIDDRPNPGDTDLRLICWNPRSMSRPDDVIDDLIGEPQFEDNISPNLSVSFGSSWTCKVGKEATPPSYTPTKKVKFAAAPSAIMSDDLYVLRRNTKRADYILGGTPMEGDDD